MDDITHGSEAEVIAIAMYLAITVRIVLIFVPPASIKSVYYT